MMIPDNQTKENPSYENSGEHLLRTIRQVKQRFFPHYERNVQTAVTDPRTHHADYKLTELIWSGVMLFALHNQSRNSLNAFRKIHRFKENYEKVFKYRLPHMDTLDHLLQKGLREAHLEALLVRLVHHLMKKKVFRPFQEFGHYLVAIDATGVVSFDHPHCDQCLTRTNKNGKTTWFHSVLEARLIGCNGFCMPLMSEWISNTDEPYEKQDCELKAFKRLADRLKKHFKRTKFLIVADGLYANDPFMTICKNNRWPFLVTLKPKSLTTVWEDMKGLAQLTPPEIQIESDQGCERSYQSLDLEYKEHALRFAQCQEVNDKTGQSTTYSYLCSLSQPAKEIVRCGRLRQKIENEGFNVAKHHGYALQHLFSRDFPTLRLYHLLRSIAIIIMQLAMRSKRMWKMRKKCKDSWAHIHQLMKAKMCFADLDPNFIGADPPGQFRYNFRRT